MLFARSRGYKWLNSRELMGSQGVVCKILQPLLSVPQALLSPISFHLLRVVPAILLPIVRVRLAPLLWTLQADLVIHRVDSDLLPMIFRATLALARGPVADLLLRIITVRLKALPTVAATAILHRAAPDENERGSFSLEAPLSLVPCSHRDSRPSSCCRGCADVAAGSSRPSLDGRHGLRLRSPRWGRKDPLLCGVVWSTNIKGSPS